MSHPVNPVAAQVGSEADAPECASSRHRWVVVRVSIAGNGDHVAALYVLKCLYCGDLLTTGRWPKKREAVD